MRPGGVMPNLQSYLGLRIWLSAPKYDSSLSGFDSQGSLYLEDSTQLCTHLWSAHLLAHKIRGSPPPLIGTNLWWNICPQPQCSATSHLTEMFQSLDPSNLVAAGVVLVCPSSCQDTKTCISHMPIMLVEPWDHLEKLPQHHHVLSLTTLLPSCTKNQVFDHYLSIKTLFAALYSGFRKFSSYGHPCTQKKPNFYMGWNAQVGMA